MRALRHNGRWWRCYPTTPSPLVPFSISFFLGFLNTMGSGSRIKFAICEVLQFAAFCVPLFTVMQRFALILYKVKLKLQPSGGDFSTAYWLIVALSVAYVMTVALLVWLPMKYMVFLKKKILVQRKKWRPVALAYVLLSTLPSFAFLIASSEVQIRSDMRLDTFTELPVSLMLFSLICIDIVERIRYCRLTGQANELHRDADIPTLNSLETVMPIVGSITGITPATTNPAPQNGAGAVNVAIPGLPGNGTIPSGTGNGMVTGLTVSGAVPGMTSNTIVPAVASNGTTAVLPVTNNGQPCGICPLTGLPLRNIAFTSAYSGPFRFLLASDVRAEAFTESFLFWLDTAEMVRIANQASVYFSGWALPIYIFSFISLLRLSLMPDSPLLSPLGVALQDLPFLFLRIAILAIFGCVTPVLFVLKNLLVCLAYIYFNFMTKLKVFNTERMF